MSIKQGLTDSKAYRSLAVDDPSAVAGPTTTCAHGIESTIRPGPDSTLPILPDGHVLALPAV